ncbi:AAA family ATPase, partial [Acinetobacter nosocomialis]|uniref:AAA family ATPase n=1 Tax=Acinetobacter nosocomialis TaxID=106654 RepID=UPI0012501D81
SAVNWYSSSGNDEDNDIFNNSINEDKEFVLDLKANSDEIINLYYLIECDLINVTNIYFYRNNNSVSEIPIKDMSSGQLCIISSFSSIAARIKNGSLVFIDEPEISLHPSWASKYIELLQEKFSMFKRCHFIVATHSPHIVSNLPNDNAYVVTLKNNNVSECIKSNLFNFKSVDFQLAKIFDFPGDRNEYLIRIIMVILTKLSENKPLNKDEFKNIEELKGFLPKLKDNDPVKHLIQQISVLIDNE